ncbi:MAG: hypothetical protein AAB533_03025 [Patescibacteria group bacterium]
MPRAYTKQQLQERYEKLPDALKDAMFSTDVADKIFETGKKNGLTIEKIGFLAEETGRVILGLTRPNEFVAVLTGRLSTPADAAQKIASDINHQIFFPLREILKSTHQVDIGDAARPAADIDLRRAARPVTPVPPAAQKPMAPAPPPPAPQKPPVPPLIDLRKTEPGRPPLVEVGNLRAPGPTPSGFLTREEVEKVVAEKKNQESIPDSIGDKNQGKAEQTIETPPLVPTPPAAPPSSTPPTPASAQLSPLSKIAPIDLRKQDSPQPSPSYPQPSSPGIPQSFPQEAPPPKMPPMDLRKDKETDLEFTPPLPARVIDTTPSQSVPPSATPAPGPNPPAPRPAPASTPPPIDLRKLSVQPPTPTTPKTKPWSGTDPYRESAE